VYTNLAQILQLRTPNKPDSTDNR